MCTFSNRLFIFQITESSPPPVEFGKCKCMIFTIIVANLQIIIKYLLYLKTVILYMYGTFCFNCRAARHYSGNFNKLHVGLGKYLGIPPGILKYHPNSLRNTSLNDVRSDQMLPTAAFWTFVLRLLSSTVCHKAS